MIPCVMVPIIAGILGPSVSSAADGTWYRASRPALTLLFKVEGNRVSVMRGFYRQHCSNGRRHTFTIRRAEFNRPINEVGRFRWESSTNVDTFSFLERGRGTVHPKLLTGHFFNQFTRAVPGNSYRCWTGRSFRDPWSYFAARRLAG